MHDSEEKLFTLRLQSWIDMKVPQGDRSGIKDLYSNC